MFHKALIGYTGWCGLGFVRGMHSYNYNLDKDKNPMYLDKILHGCLGVVVYGNPVAFPFILYKEVYRLEVDVRNIENEKITRFYNDLM